MSWPRDRCRIPLLAQRHNRFPVQRPQCWGSADEVVPRGALELCRAIYPQVDPHELARQDHNVFVDPDESAKVMAVSLRAHRERMNR